MIVQIRPLAGSVLLALVPRSTCPAGWAGVVGTHGSWRPIRVGLALVDAFVAVTAIGGGIALAAGAEGDRFPATWLVSTPFASYLLPGLMLAVAVGGSAALALVAMLRSPWLGARLTTLAGLVLISWIAGEILIATADGGLISATEAVYLLVGVIMVAFGYRFAGGWRVP